MAKIEKYNYSAKLDRVVDGDTCDALIDLGFNTYVKKRIRFMELIHGKAEREIKKKRKKDY